MTHPWPTHHLDALIRLVGASTRWVDVAAGMQAVRPGITAAACRVRAGRLGLALDVAAAPWTDDQDAALIRAVCSLRGWSAVASYMQAARPKVTRDAVRERARRLGLCDEGEPWSDQ